MIAIEPLFDQLTDGICVSNGDGDVLYMNPAAKKMLQVEEPQGGLLNTCHLLCGRLFADGETAACLQSCCMREKFSEKTEATFQGRHGPQSVYEWKDWGVERVDRWKNLRVRCLKAPGFSLGLGDEERHFTLIEDVSAQRELEKSKEDWRRMVAHDLRSPLTNIMATLLLVEKAAGRALNEKEKHLLEIAVRSGRRISDLLDLFLDLAKLEEGKMPLRSRNLALEPFLRRLAQEQWARTQAKGVSLEIPVAPDVSVLADADLLERVVGNLLDNAVKFTPSGGRVTVSAGVEAKGVEIRVADTGPGIPAEEIPLVFDRYYQGQARRRGKTQGNGLGLAFCREALKLMGAQIGVRSQVGRGSEFIITFPVSS